MLTAAPHLHHKVTFDCACRYLETESSFRYCWWTEQLQHIWQKSDGAVACAAAEQPRKTDAK
jgi:hypothetical protein